MEGKISQISIQNKRKIILFVYIAPDGGMRVFCQSREKK